MLETMLRLSALGITIATAAIEPEFPGRFFLTELGFCDVSVPILFDDYPRQGTRAQCIRLHITPERQEHWLTLWEKQVARLLGYNYGVRSDLNEK
jgi:hypothetical protein